MDYQRWSPYGPQLLATVTGDGDRRELPTYTTWIISTLDFLQEKIAMTVQFKRIASTSDALREGQVVCQKYGLILERIWRRFSHHRQDIRGSLWKGWIPRAGHD